MRAAGAVNHPTLRSSTRMTPVAIDILEAELTQPSELRLDVEQAVRRILILDWLANRCEERQM
jgi:hypothetical protein